MTDGKPEIVSLSELSLGYRPGEDLLTSVSVSIQSGEMIALVGRNGAGKSTLLRTIARIQSPAGGKIRIMGKPAEEYSLRQLSRTISFVDTGRRSTENLSVFEMVSLGRHPYTNWWGGVGKEDREKIMESLRFVGMGSFVDKKVEQLSDGERQRVRIAMALAQDTQLILLDEPAAHLDIPHSIEISEVLFRLKEANRSVLYSTHDLDSAFEYADKLWLIHDGKLFSGAPEDLGIINIYQHLFEDENVDFDLKNLRFQRRKTPGKPVYLHPCEDPVVFAWTCQAINRSGFELSGEIDKRTPEIRIGKESGRWTWELNVKNALISCMTLFELREHLTKVQ